MSTTLSQETIPVPDLELRVSGMDCANCALTLERSISLLEGVEHVEVNFATTKLILQGNVEPDALEKRVKALGYDLISGDEQPTQSDDTISTRRRGVLGFIQYMLSARETIVAFVGALLLLVTLPLSLLPANPIINLIILGIHLSVIAFAGAGIILKGMRALFVGRQITIDLLMGIATIGALLIGETGEAATVILLFAIGEALEGFTAERSRDSLRELLTLKPAEATVLRPCMDCAEHLGQNGYEGGPCPFCDSHETAIPVEEINIGETVIVRPGERIPVDGQILAGLSSVNQAPITGESVPVSKSPGEEVFAGTINGEGVLELAVTRQAENSTISQIVRLVEEAQSKRSPTERFIDRFARWYTPAVVVLAALLAVIPPLVFGAPFFDTPTTRGWLYRALALLIIACPCALVISTPVTIVSSLTGLARRGILVKGGAYLDTLARVRAFAFDKTGTLTAGQPLITQAVTVDCSPDLARCAACDDLLALAVSVERRSEHPLARAIIAEAEARNVLHRYSVAESIEVLAGRGVQGQLNGEVVTVGSHPHFHEAYEDCKELHERVVQAEQAGQTTMLVGQGDQILGFIAVADVPRQSSREALENLKQIDSKIHTIMLTGDNQIVAQAIAGRVEYIDEVQSGLLPADKVTAIEGLKTTYGTVAMIGDGINDAPALAAASLGIAMGGAGTAQAMETADVVLMQDDLTHLPYAVQTSRRARRIILQNIWISLGLKAIFLSLTLPGLTTMWMAVFADMGASLIVTLNGMRMLRQRAEQ